MLAIDASFASMELKQTMERMNSGRKNCIKDGGKLGRTQGATETIQLFLSNYREVVKYLKAGQFVQNTMNLTSKSSGTVQKVKKTLSS